MKKAVIIIAMLLAISAALNIIYIRSRVSCGADGQTRPDTVRLVDTLRYVSPAPVRDTIVRYVRVTAPIATQPPDTAARAVAATDSMRSINGIADTAAVIIPITSRTYSTPEFTATVSGYQPSLDSITIHAPRTIITNNTPAVKSKPWSIGIAAGIGAGRGGITPFIGITLQYSIIRF